MTVYVVQDDGRHKLGDARRYGELSVIFRDDIYPDDVDEQMPVIMVRAYEALHNFSPLNDYLALVGAPAYAAICSYVLGDMGVKPVRLLRFDRHEHAYYPVVIA